MMTCTFFSGRSSLLPCCPPRAFGHTILFISISSGSETMKPLRASPLVSQVVILPVPDSLRRPDVVAALLMKERLRAGKIGLQRRTAGTTENELMENVSIPASLGSKSLNTSGRQFRYVETAQPHAVPKFEGLSQRMGTVTGHEHASLNFCSRCSISWAPGFPFLSWHKLTVGCVTSRYPTLWSVIGVSTRLVPCFLKSR